MPSAAVKHLYCNLSNQIYKVSLHTNEFSKLENHDIKKLAAILRDYPSVTSPDPILEQEYWTSVKRAISDLPTHMRARQSSLPRAPLRPSVKNIISQYAPLCSGHKGLNHPLIADLWDLIKHELDTELGRFLYPLIIQVGLPAVQEYRMRHLEPVLEMWRRDYTTSPSAPEGRDPIPTTGEWRFQEDACPACMLARVGSDQRVCFALLAGLVGRMKRRNAGHRDRPESYRVRWARYWVKMFEGGQQLVKEAWDLGKELRRTGEAWEESQRESVGRDFYGREIGGGKAGAGRMSQDTQ